MKLPDVISHIPGLRWPGLPGTDGARLLALQYQYAMSERWPAEQMDTAQFRQIEALVTHCDRALPFWRDRLRRAGLRAGQPITRQAWSRLPILTRREAQDMADQVRPNATPSEHGEILSGGTSGSTGIPLQWFRSGLGQLHWNGINLRNALWHGHDVREKIVNINRPRGAPDVQREAEPLTHWGASFAPFNTGPARVLDIRLPIADQVEILLRERPGYIVAPPSAIALLARHCRAGNHTLPGLRGIATYSEVLTEETRLLCKDAFGVGIADAYSAEEAGFVALQCPHHTHYHVMSEFTKVEIVRADGRPCAPGEIGRVVVTPLHNFAMPLLRYHLGDEAELGPPCPCGRTLPVLTRILGRARDWVRLPDGSRRTPFYGATQLHEIQAIIQHQLAQTAPEMLEYRLVVHRPLTAEEEAQLTRQVQRNLGHPFQVRFRYVNSIARSASGKYLAFINEMPDD